jgi:hypothetical protein
LVAVQRSSVEHHRAAEHPVVVWRKVGRQAEEARYLAEVPTNPRYPERPVGAAVPQGLALGYSTAAERRFDRDTS